MAPRSPNRNTRPIITKDHGRPSSPLAKSSGVQLESSYIIPASSSSGRHHQRHSSLNSSDKFLHRDREARDRSYHGSGVSRITGGDRTLALRQPVARERTGRDDRDYNYEYTGPREEFLRDSAARPRHRRDSYNIGRERPVSMVGLDRPEPEYHRVDREARPPVSLRDFDNLGKPESQRQSYRARDDGLSQRDLVRRGYPRDDRDETRYRNTTNPHHQSPDGEFVEYPEESSRHHRPRKPTLEDDRPELHNRTRKPTLEDDRVDPRPRDFDEQYERGGDDRVRKNHDRGHHREHDSRRDYDGSDDKDRRVRDEPRDKRDRNDDGGTHKGLLAGAGAATAATSLAAEGVRRHHHKDSRDEDVRSAKGPQEYLREPERDREGSENTSISGDNRLSEEHEGEDREERRRRRRREREREEREYREAREEERRARDPEHRESRIPERRASEAAQMAETQTGSSLHPPQGDPSLREQGSFERRPEPSHPHRHRRHRRHHSHTRDTDSYSDPSSSSESSVDGPPRQPRVVTPSNEDKPSPPQPPKGILKKAREKFPENPNHVREGVAPLDAAKKGIPPEARWTRINRKLVNPEALEHEGVRFEEYPEYVIVLKVLSQEEINKYAGKTYEIREKRRLMMGGAEGQQGGGSDASRD